MVTVKSIFSFLQWFLVFLSAVKPEIVLALMVGGRGVPLAGFAWPPHSPANFPANQQLGLPTWGVGRWGDILLYELYVHRLRKLATISQKEICIVII
jgi:hypothetical protein